MAVLVAAVAVMRKEGVDIHLVLVELVMMGRGGVKVVIYYVVLLWTRTIKRVYNAKLFVPCNIHRNRDSHQESSESCIIVVHIFRKPSSPWAPSLSRLSERRCLTSPSLWSAKTRRSSCSGHGKKLTWRDF